MPKADVVYEADLSNSQQVTKGQGHKCAWYAMPVDTTAHV